MVKVGFIVEGDSEKLIIESVAFQNLLKQIGIQQVGPVINAAGNGNLLPQNIEPFLQSLEPFEPDEVIILTDLDEDKCITLTKQRVDPNSRFVTIVSVRKIESWFIADRDAYNSFLEARQDLIDAESIANPYEHIRSKRMQLHDKGVNKILLVRAMLKKGFSVENSDAPSAQYFVTRLKKLVS